MLYLYLTRHGETIWNTQSRMQGRQDSPLTENGLQQAADLARQLSAVPLDLVWTSPAPRAVRTAEIVIAAQPRPVVLQIDERIQEMALGDWEGLSVAEASASDPANLQAFMYQPEQFQPVGAGENFRQVSDRMAEFLEMLSTAAKLCRESATDQHWLVISHNITLKALFALMQNRPLAMLRDGPPIRQATLYVATFEDGWTIKG